MASFEFFGNFWVVVGGFRRVWVVAYFNPFDNKIASHCINCNLLQHDKNYQLKVAISIFSNNLLLTVFMQNTLSKLVELLH